MHAERNGTLKNKNRHIERKKNNKIEKKKVYMNGTKLATLFIT